MQTTLRNIILSLIFLTTVVAGGVFYTQLPNEMTSHWNIAGIPDDTTPKHLAVLMGPLLLLVIYLFMTIIPHIDPLSENIEHFRVHYDYFWIALATFLAYIHGLMLAWNVGVQFDFGRALLPAIAVLWYFIGTLLKHAEPNWFVGIRTPWTLSDERVWLSTHRLGSNIFKIGAVFMLGSVVKPTLGFVVVMVCALGSSLFLVVYSYVAYRRLHLK